MRNGRKAWEWHKELRFGGGKMGHEYNAWLAYANGILNRLMGCEKEYCPYKGGEERDRWLDGWNDCDVDLLDKQNRMECAVAAITNEKEQENVI